MNRKILQNLREKVANKIKGWGTSFSDDAKTKMFFAAVILGIIEALLEENIKTHPEYENGGHMDDWKCKECGHCKFCIKECKKYEKRNITNYRFK